MTGSPRRGVKANPFEVGEKVRFKKEHRTPQGIVKRGTKGKITRVGDEYEAYRMSRAPIVYTVQLNNGNVIENLAVNYLEEDYLNKYETCSRCKKPIKDEMGLTNCKIYCSCPSYPTHWGGQPGEHQYRPDREDLG